MACGCATFPQFDEINSTSHLLNAGLEMPLGSRTLLRLSDHFSTGVLEATEVDPGQEYFFNLSRSVATTIELGRGWTRGRADFVDGSVGFNDVRFEEPQAVFFLRRRAAPGWGAGLTFGDNLRGGLYYGYERIPPPRAPAGRFDRALLRRGFRRRFRRAHHRPGHRSTTAIATSPPAGGAARRSAG